MTIKVMRKISQIMTLEKVAAKDGRNLTPDDIGIIDNGAIAFDDNKILWVGEDNHLPEEFHSCEMSFHKDQVVIPEIVDSHTHVVFGGDRAHEYTMKINGADYEAIGKAGGGILNTMNGTNSLSYDELFKIAKDRVKTIHSYGVGTLEIKSGYALNFEKEYELSHIINDLKKYFAGRVNIVNTYMAAHAVPKSFGSSKEYTTKVVVPLMEKLAKENIIDVVDIFHEKNYFDTEDVLSLFNEAQKFNLKLKMHADEFHDNKGAVLATKYNAISADHLLMTGDDGIEALKNSKTVATLLPGTGFFLGKPQARARTFLDRGCKVAIGSDFNPGSCHCDNIVLVASIAAPTYKMNYTEMFAAITFNAAGALGIQNQGAIIKGFAPRFSIFNTNKIAKITYSWGKNLSTNMTILPELV